jgi:hypothetical protein
MLKNTLPLGLSQTVNTSNVRTILWEITAHSRAAEVSTLVGCCAVSLGNSSCCSKKNLSAQWSKKDWLLRLLDPYNPFKCQKLFTQHSITSKNNLIFRSVFLYSQVSDNSGINLHQSEQDMQCTYNVILTCVCATIIAVEYHKYYIFYVCSCNLRYPACNAHVPHYHLWPVQVYNIFPHYLINSKIFEKKLLNIKYVSIFSTAFVRNISHSKQNGGRYDTNVFKQTAHYACHILMKLEFSWQIFKYSQISNFM